MISKVCLGTCELNTPEEFIISQLKGINEIGNCFGMGYAAVSLVCKRVQQKTATTRPFRAEIQEAEKTLINYLKA